MPAGNDRGKPERPDYKVYRSRPGFLRRRRSPDLASTRKKAGGGERKPPPREGKKGKDREAKEPRTGRRRVLKWVGIAALVWLALSFLAFAVSAQIQSTKLADGAGDVLGGNPFLAVNPQNILVLGTDVRPSGLASVGEASSDHCIKAAGEGKTPPAGCSPYRADTIMVLRAGGTTFRKLSIPRDTYASIPGHDAQKINAAYAFGGARLEIQTVEQFLGIDIDHVAIVDFVGFRDFIDAIGGVEVELDTPVCSDISGGASNGGFTLKLGRGEHTLDGDEALTLARTRENTCGTGDFTGTDIERAKFQQAIISGIKNRLTDPWRIPYNFVKGPLIGWNAPKAFVSDMGLLAMPQLVFSAALGGDSGADVLKPVGTGPLGSISVAQTECERAVRTLLGHAPDAAPPCSPL